MSVYDIIKEAILTKKVIRAIYQGRERVMCPHALGTKGERFRAMFYQFDGYSSSGLAREGSPDNWRCMDLDQLSDASSEPGRWRTGENHSKKQTCVDRVLVEVAY